MLAMQDAFGDGRHVKGVTLEQLVKAVKGLQRRRPQLRLSPRTEIALQERILVSKWYPLQFNLELSAFLYREMLGGDPNNALMAGVAGGTEAWSGPHRIFVAERGPRDALRAMGRAWNSYFDFGSLAVDMLDADAVRFTIEGYPDIPVYHGMLIAGWHLAAARMSGCLDATVEVEQRPWEGAPKQVHVVRLVEPTKPR